MTTSWWDVLLTISGLCLAVWVATKLDFRGCDGCTYDCDQGRNCPRKTKQ